MEFEENFNRILVLPKSRNEKGDFTALSCRDRELMMFFTDHSAQGVATGNSPTLRHLRPKSWLFTRHTRQLVNEALTTFKSVQTLVTESTSTSDEINLIPIFVKKSREYRSMLQACVCSINAALDKEPQSSDLYQQMAEQCQLLYKMELLLGLAEIVFIDARPSSLVLGQLVCWVRLHFTSCTEQMVAVMNDQNPCEHPLYWDCIYGLACQGRLSEARQLLLLHHHSHTDPFTAMEEILRKMPTFQPYSGVSEAEFTLRWQHWQSECESRLSQGEFVAWSHLVKLAQILSGNSTTIKCLICLATDGTSETDGAVWIPYLLAVLLYTQPNIKLYRLHSAALQAVAECDAQLSPFDHLLLSVIEGDVLQVVRSCQQTLDNLWLSAHLTDLLLHARNSVGGDSEALAALRDTLVQDYALELADHNSLWQIGVVYLDYYTSGSRMQNVSPLVSLVLERVPLTSEDKAHKVVNMAIQRGLNQLAASVCKVMGRRACRDGRLAAAIWWGVRAGDPVFTEHTAHQVLHRYLNSGEFQSSALLLDHLGSAMLLCDTLTFLGKYREFHSLYEKKQHKMAGELLVTLIASKLAPQYFWPVLLLDALSLLQQTIKCRDEEESEKAYQEVVFSSLHSYELMYCLNTVMNRLCSKQEEACGAGMMCELLLRETELRRLLSHNLARAIVAEGTTCSGEL